MLSPNPTLFNYNQYFGIRLGKRKTKQHPLNKQSNKTQLQDSPEENTLELLCASQ